MTEFIRTATETGGGGVLASFGSGDTTGQGRLRRAADQGRGNRNASPGQVRAVTSRINREMGTVRPNSAAARRRRALLQEIDDNRNNRGNINMRVLADIRDQLAEL